MITYFIGLDLGREQDYTAWGVLERRRFYWCPALGKYILHDKDYDWDLDERKEKLGLIGLSQVPLHTSWPKVAEELEGLIKRCFEKEKDPNVDRSVQVWIDASGLGSPVMEGFIEPVIREYENCSMYPVKIVPGEEGYNSDSQTVSKIHLIDNALVMREKEEFVIAKDLRNQPIMELFEKQIQDFRRKEGKRAGTIRYEAIEGEHDDLVIAFSLSCLGVKQVEPNIFIIGGDEDEEDFRRGPGLSDDLLPWRPLSG